MKSYCLDDGRIAYINNFTALRASTHQNNSCFYVMRFKDLKNLKLVEEVKSKWDKYGKYVKEKTGRDILVDFFRMVCIGILLKHNVKMNKVIDKKKSRSSYAVRISCEITNDNIADDILKEISVMLDKWMSLQKIIIDR